MTLGAAKFQVGVREGGSGLNIKLTLSGEKVIMMTAPNLV